MNYSLQNTPMTEGLVFDEHLRLYRVSQKKYSGLICNNLQTSGTITPIKLA